MRISYNRFEYIRIACITSSVAFVFGCGETQISSLHKHARSSASLEDSKQVVTIDPNTPPPIYVVGTEEYALKARGFKVSPSQARKIADQYDRLQEKEGLVLTVANRHVVIVGDEYLFNWWLADKLGQLHLNGYFVDGNTGAAIERYTPWVISPGEHAKLGERMAELRNNMRRKSRAVK